LLLKNENPQDSQIVEKSAGAKITLQKNFLCCLHIGVTENMSFQKLRMLPPEAKFC